MSISQKNAIVIGSTNLCLECIKCLLDEKWSILSIITDDDNIILWAEKLGIKTLNISEVNSSIFNEKFYLFSIINPYIISDSILILL